MQHIIAPIGGAKGRQRRRLRRILKPISIQKANDYHHIGRRRKRRGNYGPDV
jgi:hypothetical protein